MRLMKTLARSGEITAVLLMSAAVLVSTSIPPTARLHAQPLSKEEEARLKARQKERQQPPQGARPGTPPPAARTQPPPGGPPQGRPQPPPQRTEPPRQFLPPRGTPPPTATEPRRLPPQAVTPAPAPAPRIDPNRLDRRPIAPRTATPPPTTTPSTPDGRKSVIITPGSTQPPAPGPGRAPGARESGTFLPKRNSSSTGQPPANAHAPGTGRAAGPAPAPVFSKPGVPVAGRTVAPPPGPAKIDDVKRSRVERVDAGNRRIIEEPGNRVIIKQDNRTIIRRDEGKAIQALHPDARTSRRPGGVTETVYVRRDGMRVVTEVDGSGRLLRRYGRGHDGREIVYVDNRRFYRNLGIGVGIAAVGIGVALALAPPVVALPREKYIVEYDRASDDDIYEALIAPPVERLERAYSLDEIRYTLALRDRMRRVDLDTITFEFGSFEVTEDQYNKLERIARAIGRAVEANPAEVFMVEGHTDAVGSDEDNLSLSDRRAESVARILTEYYSIPMENLVTQGYGEQFLKIPTQGPERANRRVAVRRITPLLSQEGGPDGPPPPR